jgi:nicotinamidase-related amidase
MKHFLVVVDMQKDFINGSLGTAEAVSIRSAAVEKIKTFDGEILATLDTHSPAYLNTAEGKKLPVEHCIKGTPGWQLDPEIRTALESRGYLAVEKPTFGSLLLPQLIEDAAAGEDFDVTLIGLCTDICVVSNALCIKAAIPETPISCDASCCAGVTPAKHEAALETMRSCQVKITE